MLEFRSASATAVVDPAAGGRLATLRIDGVDVLVGPEADPMRWGSYPMVPFAGRIRNGRFGLDGRSYELPINAAPHAIHGYGYTSRWEVLDEASIAYDFGPPWPFAGRAVQTFTLDDDRLLIEMRTTAIDRQPLICGWHPWFRRDLGFGPEAAATVAFDGGRMYELDAVSIPTGALVDVGDGPLDNCITGVTAGPRIRWGQHLDLQLSSSADHWVVFTEPDHALCVEPQTDAPDAMNRGRSIVEAGRELQVSFEIRWS